MTTTRYCTPHHPVHPDSFVVTTTEADAETAIAREIPPEMLLMDGSGRAYRLRRSSGTYRVGNETQAVFVKQYVQGGLLP